MEISSHKKKSEKREIEQNSQSILSGNQHSLSPVFQKNTSSPIPFTPPLFSEKSVLNEHGKEVWHPQKQLSFFQKIGKFFTSLFRFLLRLKPQETRDENELRCIIDMFKSDETGLLDLFNHADTPYEIKPSYLLSLWYSYLEKSLPHWDNDSNREKIEKKMNPLRDLVQFQKKIEDIQDTFWGYIREKKRASLQKTLFTTITNLKKDECTYIPGGYCNAVNKAFMIYEITKKGDKEYTVRVFDASDNSSIQTEKRESIESTCSLDSDNKLREFLEVSTRVLSGRKLSCDSVNLKGLIKEKIRDYFSSHDGFDKLYPEKSRMDIFDEKIKKPCAKNPNGILKQKRQMQNSGTRLTHLFMKSLCGESAQERKSIFHREKTIFQARGFLKLITTISEVQKENPIFRAWMRQNIEKLLRKLEKGESNPFQKEIVEKLTECTTLIQIEDAQQHYILPTSDHDRSRIEKNFHEKIELETLPLKSILYVTQNRTILPIIFDRAAFFQNISENKTEMLETEIERLEILRNNKDFIAVRAGVLKIFSIFEDLIDQSPSQIPSIDFMKLITQLQLLLVQTAWGLQRFSPSHEDIHITFFALVLQDTIYRHHAQNEIAKGVVRHTDSYVSEYALNIADLVEFIYNPSLSLDISYSKIVSRINYFYNLQKTPVSLLLVNSGSLKARCENSYKLFQTYTLGEEIIQALDPQDIEKTHRKILSSLAKEESFLSPFKEFAYLRQSVIGAHILLAPFNSMTVEVWEEMTNICTNFIFSSNTERVKNIIPLYEGAVRWRIKDKNYRKKIIGQLQKPILKNISLSTSFLGIKKYSLGARVHILPLNLKLMGLPIQGNRENNFNKNGIKISKKIAQLFFTTSVAISDSDLCIYMNNGDLIVSNMSPSYCTSGITEHTILQKSDHNKAAFKDLRLCLTDPQKSRAENILGFIQKNSPLINDIEFGPFLTRLLETALFHINSVLRQNTQSSYKASRGSDIVVSETIILNNGLFFLNQGVNSSFQLKYDRFFSILNDLFPLLEQLIQADFDDGAASLFATCVKILHIIPDPGLWKLKLDTIEKNLQEKSLNPSAQTHILESLLIKHSLDFDRGTLSLSEENLKKIIENIFQYKHGIARKEWRNPLHEERIQIFLKKIQPSIQNLLQNPECNTNRFLNSLLKKDDLQSIWVSSDGLIWTCENYSIDCSRFEILEDGKCHKMLPFSITQSAQFSDIQPIISSLDSTLLDKEWLCRQITLFNNEPAFEYTPLEEFQNPCKLIELQNGKIHFYLRKKEKNYRLDWYEFKHENDISKIDRFPNLFSGNEMWISEDRTHISVERSGKKIWDLQIKPLQEGFQIIDITHCNSRKKVLGWKGLKQSHFSSLDNVENILPLGIEGKISSILYLKLDCEYRWNSTFSKWESPKFPGYLLSDKSLHAIATSFSKENLLKLFHPAFIYYHLLEKHEAGHGLILLLPGVQYANSVLESPIKEYFLDPIWKDDNSKSLFQYQIDPIKGIIPKKESQEAYLYLAYSLLAQGNLKDSFFYLGKIGYKKKYSDRFQNIFLWLDKLFEKIQDSPEKRVLEFRYSEIGIQSELISHQRYDQIHTKFSEVKDTFSLDFSLSQEEKFLLDFGRVSESRLREEIHLLEKEIEKKSSHKISQGDHSFSQHLFHNSFDKEQLEKILEKILNSETGSVNTEKKREEYYILQEEKDSYACEIEKGFQQDLISYRQKLTSRSDVTLDPRDLSAIEKTISEMRKKYQREAHQQKIEIMKTVQMKDEQNSSSLSDIEQLKNELEIKGVENNNQLFDALLRKFGEENTPFEIDPLITQFLLLSIRSHHLQRIEQVVRELQQEKNKDLFATKTGELRTLLEAKHSYDIEHNPYRKTLLLLEYTLQFVIRDHQLQLVYDNLTEKNLFKQEICGGGKTTVIRNIISHIQADGSHLAGVSTLASMRHEHGELFQSTTKQAFHQHVMDFRFSRASPSDATSLLQLHRNLLKATLHRGRIDLSKNDLQAFQSLMKLKIDEALKKQALIPSSSGEKQDSLQEEVHRLHEEIGIMEDIALFMQEKMVLIADEFDRETDVNEEYNFAVGLTKVTSIIEKKSLINLFKKIFLSNHPDLQPLSAAIRSNRLEDLTKEERKKAIRELAVEVAREHDLSTLDISREDLSHYLDHNDETAMAVYKKLSTKRENEEIQSLFYIKNFLSTIFQEAFSKKCGVSYGFASQSSQVIPYAGSDKPKEGSEYGNIAEKLVYACLNALDTTGVGGISREYIREEMDAIRKQALAELQARHEEEDETIFLSLDETESLKNWCRDLKIEVPFSKISEQDLYKKMSADPIAILALIERTLFPKICTSEEKLVSTSQDPSSMVLSYSGFSGTDLTSHAMPDCVNTKNARQVGVHGEIIHALLKSEEKIGKDATFLELQKGDTKEVTELLASQMKWGDCLCDVGKLYPGIPAQEIAKSLFNAIKKKNPDCEKETAKYIWFMNRSDQWQMISSHGNITNVDYAIDPRQKITIFDDTHTRGAERPSTDNVVEYVTISSDTGWSQFEQGVMRERNVTQEKAAVRYILSPAIAERMRDERSVSNLMHHLIKNEAIALRPLFLKAEKLRIGHILKDCLEKAKLRACQHMKKYNPERQKDLMALREFLHYCTRSLFFLSNEVSADILGKPLEVQTTEDYLDEFTNSQLKKLARIELSVLPLKNPLLDEGCKEARIRLIAKLSSVARKEYLKTIQDEKLKKEIEEKISDYKGRLVSYYFEEKVVGHSTDVGLTQHVEVEVNVATEVETEVEIEVEESQEKGNSEVFDYRWLDMSQAFSTYSKNFHTYKADSDIPISLISKNKLYTENFCPTRCTMGKQTPWSHYINPIHQTLFIINHNRVHEMIGSRLDVDKVFIPYVKKNQNSLVWLQNYSSQRVPDDIQKRINEDQAYKIMKEMILTKLLNLDTEFPAEKKKSRSDVERILSGYYQGLTSFLKENFRNVETLGEFEKKMVSMIHNKRSGITYKGSALYRAIQERKKELSQKI